MSFTGGGIRDRSGKWCGRWELCAQDPGETGKGVSSDQTGARMDNATEQEVLMRWKGCKISKIMKESPF